MSMFFQKELGPTEMKELIRFMVFAHIRVSLRIMTMDSIYFILLLKV